MLQVQQIGGAVGFSAWTAENLPIDRKALSREGTNALYVSINDSTINPISQSCGRFYIATDQGAGVVGGYLTIDYAVSFEVPQDHQFDYGYLRLYKYTPSGSTYSLLDSMASSTASNLQDRGVTWAANTMTWPDNSELGGNYIITWWINPTTSSTIQSSTPIVTGGIVINSGFHDDVQAPRDHVWSPAGASTTAGMACMAIHVTGPGTIQFSNVVTVGPATFYVLVAQVTTGLLSSVKHGFDQTRYVPAPEQDANCDPPTEIPLLSADDFEEGESVKLRPSSLCSDRKERMRR